MITVKDLSFSYSNSDDFAIKNLNFEISSGEIFGFLGPSGAGKSTTQKILYKILSGYKGEILIDHKPIDQWGKKYFERVGVGFELPNHYLKLTAKENLELFSTFYPKENLHDFNYLFEIVGLEKDMNKRVSDYSKGMKMRLNFIRAIMHNPDILFLDESTSALDPINSKKIKDHIRMLKKEGKTIFITTHDMATADQLCDRVSFIVDGSIQATEAPSKLKHEFGKKVVQVELQDEQIKEFPMENIGSNQEFLSFIKEGQLLRMDTLEATLEEVFIKITGKALSI